MTTIQQQENLHKGQETKLRRRELKRELRAERSRSVSLLIIADVIEDREDHVERALLWDLLGWGYRVSVCDRQRVFDALGVRDMFRQVRQLTDRQRAELVQLLRDEAGHGELPVLLLVATVTAVGLAVIPSVTVAIWCALAFAAVLRDRGARR
jgi:hypothetical protein